MRATTDRTTASAPSRRRRGGADVLLALVVCAMQCVAMGGEAVAGAVRLVRTDTESACCCGPACACGPGGCGGAHRQERSRTSRRDGHASIVAPNVVAGGGHCRDALAPQLTQTRPVPVTLDQQVGATLPILQSRLVVLDGAGRHAHSERSAPSPRGPPAVGI
jgi:hypothetical protein